LPAFRQSVIAVIGTSIGGLNGALLVQRLNSVAPGTGCNGLVTHQKLWETKVGWHLLRRSKLTRLIKDVFDPAALVRGPVYFVATAAVVKGPLRATTVRTEYDMMGSR